jgi:hypothetical protein
MTDYEADDQKQSFKDRRSNQERLLPNANKRQVPGRSAKNPDAIQEFGQEMTSMALGEFVYREPSEFEVIRTTTGREMTREMFVGVIGKQEKLKKGVKIRNQRRIVKMKCSESPRDGIGRMIVIGNASGVDRVERGGEQ